ncbi:NfeD family protein [Candidatus Woesearchaeota archaeon]|jgi:membrane protein implicated in regulation of membrane protease activity|nr:NfeD family protein [Candidatus Woesearchaeota archaeon]MBT7884743.1 NfeD family protein [Candidatus Neomarinimicrobiota bacterium]
MLENFWWVYVSIGILLIAVEIFTSNFIVMWFGIASIITAIPVYFDASTKVVILIYALSLLILTTFVRNITMGWFTKDEKDKATNINSLKGRIGFVTENIDMLKATGQVKVGKEIWSAVAEDGNDIFINTKIIVIKPEGAKLIVKKES